MHRKKTIIKIKFFITFIVFLGVFIVCANIYDSFTSESVNEISRQYAVTEINKSINKSISEYIQENELSSSDFIIMDEKKRILSANSVLINKLCAETSEKISYNLSKINIPAAEINLSMLTNFFALFNINFKYGIDVTSVGSAEADCETEFTSAGINSTNFRVWLNIKTEVIIVDLFHTERLNLTRKVMLIDSVIDGDVPSTYLHVRD